MIIFDTGVFTDCGNFRSKNEDSFLLCGRAMKESRRTGIYGLSTANRKFGVSAVFDGMGGAKYGEMASGISAETLTRYMEDILNLGRAGVDSFVDEANSALCSLSREFNAPVGSTMVLISVSDEKAAVYNIGDSRAYIVRRGHIKQLTKDHTVAASLSSMGIENSSKSRKHQLTQHLGIPSDEMVIQSFSLGAFSLEDGDRILLCSDGVTDGLSDKQLLSLLSRDKSAAELSKQIVKLAAEAGSKDNITAMVLTFIDDGRPAEKYSNTKKPAVSPPRVSAAKARPAPDSTFQPAPGSAARPAPVQYPADNAAVQTRSSASPSKKNRFALFWVCNVLLALMLGSVLGIIASLI